MVLAVVGIATPTRSKAEVEALLTATSDYDYRGLTQTDLRPALQVDFIYTSKHVHADVFVSNVNFGEGSGHGFYGPRHTEVAYTAGYQGGNQDRLQWDLGISYFTYPRWKPRVDYPEAYFTVTRKGLSSSLHYTWTYDNLNVQKSAYYIEANLAHPLPVKEFNILLHMGQSSGPYWSLANGKHYEDYSIGLERKTKKLDITIRDVGTADYNDPLPGQGFGGRNRVVLAVSYTFN